MNPHPNSHRPYNASPSIAGTQGTPSKPGTRRTTSDRDTSPSVREAASPRRSSSSARGVLSYAPRREHVRLNRQLPYSLEFLTHRLASAPHADSIGDVHFGPAHAPHHRAPTRAPRATHHSSSPRHLHASAPHLQSCRDPHETPDQ